MTEVEHSPILSSVVQLRLLDYARRPVAEQARLNAQLSAVLALLVPDVPARERIVLEGGGAAAVAVLGNPVAALALAERALRVNVAGVPLSVGLDHGPVELAGRGEGAAETMSGDGMATAALMAAFAPEGGLLATRSFRSALAHAAPGQQYALVAAGNFSDSGLRTHQGYRLDRAALRWRRLRLALWGAGSVTVMLLASWMLREVWNDRPRPLTPLLERAGKLLTPAPQGKSHGRN